VESDGNAYVLFLNIFLWPMPLFLLSTHKQCFFFFFYGSPTGEACGQRLGHDRWAPHHGSRVEEGELLLANHSMLCHPLPVFI
jgi:hypothetical protein